jgi:hypothetical protein
MPMSAGKDPMNTATDNYTCEERLTAAGKVHRVHGGRVVKPKYKKNIAEHTRSIEFSSASHSG